VSDSLFGERFFATRERLSELIHGIHVLAADAKADPGPDISRERLTNELLRPFTFIACGEINAGKSSLLNGLCRHDLCPTGVLPVTDRTHSYRYGISASDASIDEIEKKCRPIGFLKDFVLIDTPGTNGGDAARLDLVEREAMGADLVMCVFPVSNPWGAATWDFIARLPAEVLERTVLVIQQADLRESVDLQVILGHMADLSTKRLGRALPAFSVSAKLASEADCVTPLTARPWQASGFPALLDFISRTICLSPARCALLESWRARAAAALRLVEDQIDDQNRAINGYGHFIEGIEREIDEMRLQFVSRLPRHLANVAEVFQTEAVWVSRLLHRRLRALPSLLRLFTGERSGQQMESAFIERLRQTIEAVAEKDAGEVADACALHWQELGERVRNAMQTPLESEQPIEETLTAARQRFVRRLSGAARESIGNLKVRTRLDKELRHRNVALRSFLVMTLVFITAGASCGALGVPWLPAIFCAVAGLFFAGGVVVAWITRRSITRDFRQRLLDTCGAFASALHNDYEDAVRVVFHEYAAALGRLRTHLAREKLAIEPRLRRWQELFLTLKAIEQDLHP
jgi:hypothetical protein